MWVMSRRVGEMVHIGHEITVEVLRIAGNRVTLAVDYPKGARVLRGESRSTDDDRELVDGGDAEQQPSHGAPGVDRR